MSCAALWRETRDANSQTSKQEEQLASLWVLALKVVHTSFSGITNHPLSTLSHANLKKRSHSPFDLLKKTRISNLMISVTVFSWHSSAAASKPRVWPGKKITFVSSPIMPTYNICQVLSCLALWSIETGPVQWFEFTFFLSDSRCYKIVCVSVMCCVVPGHF